MCFTVWCVIRGTLRFFFLHDQGALEFYTYGHTLSLHDALPISEIDVVVFLVSRHFGLKNFGGLYGGLLAALSIGTALGPLAAAQIYDRTGSYEMFLWLSLGVMAASSVAIATLPRRHRAWAPVRA